MSTKAEVKVDKRSKAYRDANRKSKPIYKKRNTLKNDFVPQIPISTSASLETTFTITNLINSIRSVTEDIRKHNYRLISCVNSVVYIERMESDEGKGIKRSDTITDNLEELRDILANLSAIYNTELTTLESYIGTNK